MGNPTHHPNGMSTAAKNSTLFDFMNPDPTKAHVFFDDFDNYLAAEWVVTETGVATQALANADGGILVITNAAGIADASWSQWAGNAGAVIESFLWESNKKLWFKARFKVSDATQSVIQFGLQATDTTPVDVDDGIFIEKNDGDAYLDLVVEKDDTATRTAQLATLVADTYTTVGFYYDGRSTFFAFVDDVIRGTAVNTNAPDDEELAVSFGLQNGEAVAKNMSVDYILVAKER